MEFVAIREDLLALLTHASGVADPKSTSSLMLSHVALRASADGTVRAFATDLIRAFQGSLRAEVKRAGAVAVAAKALMQTVDGFPAKSEITVVVEKNFTTKLSAKKVRATLAGADADGLPSEPAPRPDKGVAIPATSLHDALNAVRPFMSPDNTRPHLAAVCFTGTHVVATNGHSMGVAPSPVPTPKVLVPSVAVETWRAALRDLEGDVSLHATTPEAPAALETPAGIFTTKLVDAAFPSWEQVVPRDNPWAIEVDADEVRAATRGMPTGGISGVKLSMQRDGMLDELVVAGEDIETLRTKVASVSAKVLRGREAIPSAWGSKLGYLLDALAPAKGVTVIEGHGELDPFMVTSPSVEGYFAVVMPQRVS